MVEFGDLRLRPILMTTGAMVLGSVPLALATGAGAESRQAIGWVIVGGLLLGTVLTLYVVPTAYMLLARTHRAPEPRTTRYRRRLRPSNQGISRVEPVVARPSSARWASAASREREALVDLDLDRAWTHHREQIVGAGEQ